jgi:uncharacterized membrane protein YeiB
MQESAAMDRAQGESPVVPGAGASPVLGVERISAMDTLRGVAVLGILLMNILGFAYPFVARFDPRAAGGLTGANLMGRADRVPMEPR